MELINFSFLLYFWGVILGAYIGYAYCERQIINKLKSAQLALEDIEDNSNDVDDLSNRLYKRIQEKIDLTKVIYYVGDNGKWRRKCFSKSAIKFFEDRELTEEEFKLLSMLWIYEHRKQLHTKQT